MISVLLCLLSPCVFVRVVVVLDLFAINWCLIYEILMYILPLVCYQYVIKADSGGMVEKVLFSPGESVAKNTTLVRMKDDE